MKKAGKIIMSIKNDIEYKEYIKGKTKEGYNDIVTDADLKSNFILTSFFSEKYPTMKILSEENNNINLNNNEKKFHFNKFINKNKYYEPFFTVIIDPLDATQEFSENLYQYNSIMACFLYKNKPIIGITYFPKFDQAFWVYLKHNHSSNFYNIQNIFNIKRHSNTYNLIQSRSHSSNSKNLYQYFKNKYPYVYLQSAGGAGYKTILVTGNVSDVYFHLSHIKIWDICNSVVFSKHFNYIDVYDKNLNKLEISPLNTILTNGFIFSSNSTLLSTLFKNLT